MNKDKNILLFILYTIEYILSSLYLIICGIIIKLDKSIFRYFFFGIAFLVIYSFYKTINNKDKIHVIKNSNTNIDTKYLKKLSV